MKHEERLAARKLRSEGCSIKAICRQLGVAQSSVSNWVRDIELTPLQKAKLDLQMSNNRQRFGYLSRCGGANQNR
jgi:predicted transcriptional regulator